MLTDLIGTSFSSRVTFKTKNSLLFMIHVYNFFLKSRAFKRTVTSQKESDQQASASDPFLKEKR
jgi:hypothetical protein